MVGDDLFQRARLEMVEQQIKNRGINDERVLAAFREIPRHTFVKKTHQLEAYEDHPLPIGFGQTISQPYIVALMTARLDLVGWEKVLEIGTGSGYQAAILARLSQEIHSIERIPELAQQAEGNLRAAGINHVEVHVGDGTLGWPQNAPYDAILITAGTPAMPVGLMGQLGEGGRLIAPVGSRWRQMLELWVKHDEKIKKEEVLPVVFVPLIGEQGWNEENVDS